MSNDYYVNVKKAVNLSASGEERVEVNQRALIDKILARYASEKYDELVDKFVCCVSVY